VEQAIEITHSEQQLRRAIRDTDRLSVGESERIKRLRFTIEPRCDLCLKPIEKIEDSMLITQPIGTTSEAAHCLLIHNACTVETVRRLALHLTRRSVERVR
jgi:hypothetical protein